MTLPVWLSKPWLHFPRATLRIAPTGDAELVESVDRQRGGL